MSGTPLTKEICDAKHTALQEHLTSEISHLNRALESMERSMDAKHLSNVKTLAEIAAQVKVTNGRTTKLEIWKAWMTGAIAAIGLGMPFLVTWFSYWLIAR